MLTIKDLVFSIDKSKLFGILKDGNTPYIDWYVDITTIPKPVSSGGSFPEWSPHLEADQLFSTEQGGVSSLKDLSLQLAWEEKENSDGEWFAHLYVFEHCGVYDSVMSITHKSNNIFHLSWNARCDLLQNEEYFDRLDLIVETEILLEEISALDIDANRAATIISNIFPSDRFRVEKNSDGIVSCSPVFS